MKEIKRLVIQLVVLLVALFVLYLLVVLVPVFRAHSPFGSLGASPSNIYTMEGKARVPPPHPETTPDDAIVTNDQHGFQYLVSYLETGFEPATITLKSGDTVRFTNNSADKLWIAAGGSSDTLYPNVQNGCGSSALDSCKALAPGEYWQFTFDEKETWSFQNNLDKKIRGVITVRVK